MSNSARTAFIGLFRNHIHQSGKYLEVKEDNETVILENALTAERRAKAIESFLKAAFKNLVTGNTGMPRHEDLVDYVQHGDLELTRTELAEIFGQSNCSILSNRIFDVCDTDKNGLMCAKDFALMLLTIIKGTIEEKARLVYDVYELETSHSMSLQKLIQILKTIKNNSGSIQSLDESIDALLESIGYESSEEREPEKEFIHLIVASYRTGETLQEAKTTGRIRRLSKFRVRDLTQKPDDRPEGQRKLKRVFEQKKREIGCLFVFFGVAMSFVADRVYFFAFLNEAAGWRQVTEVGLLMSRMGF